MTRMRRISGFLQAELRAVSSLVPLIVLSLLIVFVLPNSGVTLAYSFFQSPVTTPTPAAATPTPAAVTPIPAAPTPVPSEVPAAPSPELPTPATPLMETPSISATIPTEMETRAIEPQFTPAEGTPSSEPAATLTIEDQPPGSSSSPGAIFIDTCVVGLSYFWLCCGGIVLVLFVLGVLASFLLRRA